MDGWVEGWRGGMDVWMGGVEGEGEGEGSREGCWLGFWSRWVGLGCTIYIANFLGRKIDLSALGVVATLYVPNVQPRIRFPQGALFFCFVE